MKSKKSMVAVGKRKRAVARAVAKKGSGKVYINRRPVSTIKPDLVRERMLEPVYLCDRASEIDIFVNVHGGGPWGQADAVRTAIGRAIVSYFDDPEIRAKFIEYDRTIVVSDDRRTEPHKPSRSSAGPRRKKQQSKR